MRSLFRAFAGPLAALAALFVPTSPAPAQTVPGGTIIQNQVWAPSQWNSAWASKQDLIIGGDCAIALGLITCSKSNGVALSPLATSASAANLTGTLNAAQFPALSGDCTTAAGSLTITCTKTGGTPLGGAAVVDVGTSGTVLCVINTACTWGAQQTFAYGLTGTLTGSLVGNASTATTAAALAPGATISVSGDATTTTGVSFTGASNITLPVNLAVVNANTGPCGGAGSYPVPTLNGKGLATACTTQTAVNSFNTRTGAVTLSSSDITGALTYTPAHNGANTDITSLGGLTTALSVSQGGTGTGSFTAHGVLLGEGTAAVGASGALSSGQLLIGQASGDPLAEAVSGDASLAANGALTVSKTGGVAFGPLATGTAASSLTGTLNAAQLPALTGDCTSTAGTASVTCTKTGGVALTSAATTAVGTSGAKIPLLSTANTWGAEQTFPAATTSGAGVNIGQAAAAPSAPANGDLWATSAGVYAFLGGSTYQLGGSSFGVSTFNTRSGAVTLQSSDLTTPLSTPPPIGGTTPASGAFTTLSASGLISPTSTIGIKGTAAADNAQAGSVGEYASTTISNFTLTSTTTTNCGSLALTAGDWDVSGYLRFETGGGSLSSAFLGLNTTSATFPADGFYGAISGASLGSIGEDAPVTRISTASSTTVYLVCQATFTGTGAGYGFIRARRVR